MHILTRSLRALFPVALLGSLFVACGGSESDSGPQAGTGGSVGPGMSTGGALTGGSGGTGGATGGAATGGTGGAAPATIQCGQAQCTGLGAGAPTCCVNSGTACGINVAQLNACLALDAPGAMDMSCPSANGGDFPMAPPGFGLLTFAGCCTPAGTCGLLVDLSGLGGPNFGCTDASGFTGQPGMTCGSASNTGGAGGMPNTAGAGGMSLAGAGGTTAGSGGVAGAGGAAGSAGGN